MFYWIFPKLKQNYTLKCLNRIKKWVKSKKVKKKEKKKPQNDNQSLEVNSDLPQGWDGS